MAEPILIRTAKSMYRADKAPAAVKKTDYDSLPLETRRNYEVMAAAALSIALREPIDVLDLIPVGAES